MEKREATRHDIKSWLNRKKASNPRSDFGYLKSLFFNKVKLSGKQVIKNLPLTTFHLPLAIKIIAGPPKSKAFWGEDELTESEQEIPNGISASKRSNEDDMGV